MKKVCVYCASSDGNDPAFGIAAENLAAALVSRNLGLVYGGASVGIMGTLANAVMDRGGEVIGIIPQALLRREIGNHHLTELQIVDSMHERKAAMADQADAFIALPGGMGTLEELFEILTWAQLLLHGDGGAEPRKFVIFLTGIAIAMTSPLSSAHQPMCHVF